MRAVVITVSDRSAAGVRPDRSGPLLAELLAEAGAEVGEPVLVPDEPAEVTAVIRSAVEGGADVVVTTGGTGLGPRDRTPEATRAVLEREVPGVAEAIRAYGTAKTPFAALSRGLAGVAGRTLVVNLPGSTGGVRDGMAVLGPLLEHVVTQLAGGDHPPAR
ncbi:MAG: molybdenum cofactor biosynthesis protein B [Mycobacteriales bacterium]